MSCDNQYQQPVTILMAEDDEDDRELARDALAISHVANDLRFVFDGQDLLDYLRREGRHAGDATATPRPGVVLLDLHMPRKNGHEALAEIKSDPSLRQIPVVVLTTSHEEDDVTSAYDLGASSFITKPSTMSGLIQAMQTLSRYWLELVDLPSGAVPG
ncbi:MAG TPA: response regulator [Frankiaceae bacterium]|jgi:CheY-like chemotaxis protein|nr:response regulator [Frankiaceae bacterium]